MNAYLAYDAKQKRIKFRIEPEGPAETALLKLVGDAKPEIKWADRSDATDSMFLMSGIEFFVELK